METVELATLIVERQELQSLHLHRAITLDFYLPKNVSIPSHLSLLLINDGQDLEKMRYSALLDALSATHSIQPLLCVGIHAGHDRKMEYGTAKLLDFKGRGAKAAAYHRFILHELLPYIHKNYFVPTFQQIGVAGFSLGGLTAIDIVWTYPQIFSMAGVFSGSLWWRTRDLHKGYNEDTDRIMHQQIRNGHYQPHLKFYITTGSLDETADRNNNGIIDSIDDSLDLITELENLGYKTGSHIQYINYEDGRHDVETWGRAMPQFLRWAFGSTKTEEVPPEE